MSALHQVQDQDLHGVVEHAVRGAGQRPSGAHATPAAGAAARVLVPQRLGRLQVALFHNGRLLKRTSQHISFRTTQFCCILLYDRFDET